MLRHRMYGQILAMSTPSSTEQHHSSSSMLRPRIYMVLLCFAAHSAVLRVRVQLQAGRELRRAARPAALSAQHKGDSWPTSKSWTSKLVQLVDTLVIHHIQARAIGGHTGHPPQVHNGHGPCHRLPARPLSAPNAERPFRTESLLRRRPAHDSSTQPLRATQCWSGRPQAAPRFRTVPARLALSFPSP